VTTSVEAGVPPLPYHVELPSRADVRDACLDTQPPADSREVTRRHVELESDPMIDGLLLQSDVGQDIRPLPIGR
jgi:hypothetical protein